MEHRNLPIERRGFQGIENAGGLQENIELNNQNQSAAQAVVVNDAHDGGAMIIGSDDNQEPLAITIEDASDVLERIMREETENESILNDPLQSAGQETVEVNEAHDGGAMIIDSDEDQESLTIKVEDAGDVLESIKTEETQNKSVLNDPLQSAGQETVEVNNTRDGGGMIIDSDENQKPLTVYVEGTSGVTEGTETEETQKSSKLNDSLVVANDPHAPTIISLDEEDIIAISSDEDEARTIECKPSGSLPVDDADGIENDNKSETVTDAEAHITPKIIICGTTSSMGGIGDVKAIESTKTKEERGNNKFICPLNSIATRMVVLHDDAPIVISSDEDEKPLTIKVEDISDVIESIRMEETQKHSKSKDLLPVVKDRHASTIISSYEEDVITISSDEDEVCTKAKTAECKPSGSLPMDDADGIENDNKPESVLDAEVKHLLEMGFSSPEAKVVSQYSTCIWDPRFDSNETETTIARFDDCPNSKNTNEMGDEEPTE